MCGNPRPFPTSSSVFWVPGKPATDGGFCVSLLALSLFVSPDAQTQPPCCCPLPVASQPSRELLLLDICHQAVLPFRGQKTSLLCRKAGAGGFPHHSFLALRPFSFQSPHQHPEDGGMLLTVSIVSCSSWPQVKLPTLLAFSSRRCPFKATTATLINCQFLNYLLPEL